MAWCRSWRSMLPLSMLILQGEPDSLTFPHFGPNSNAKRRWTFCSVSCCSCLLISVLLWQPVSLQEGLGNPAMAELPSTWGMFFRCFSAAGLKYSGMDWNTASVELPKPMGSIHQSMDVRCIAFHAWESVVGTDDWVWVGGLGIDHKDRRKKN